MRRRADIWAKYKDNPDFRLYDIYHWEAHPSSQYPEPTTLEQRITHYEAYLKKFPEVVWPGFVQEPSNPVSEQFGLWQDYYGDQTYLVLVDKAGRIAYQNSFPKGIMNITKIYDDIEREIPPLLEEEGVLTKSQEVLSHTVSMVNKKLELQTAVGAVIQIYGVNGVLYNTTNALTETSTIDLREFASGVYFMVLTVDGYTEKQSFIIP